VLSLICDASLTRQSIHVFGGYILAVGSHGLQHLMYTGYVSSSTATHRDQERTCGTGRQRQTPDGAPGTQLALMLSVLCD